MGTRGIIGFYHRGRTYGAFNAMDSDPEYLGIEVINYLRRTNICELREKMSTIIVVDPDKKPTPKAIDICRSAYTGTKTPISWNELLRSVQSFDVFDLPYMINNKSFLYNSLFCEWAYIINLDAKTLEIYKGLNKKIGKGRYADIPEENKKPVTFNNGRVLPWDGYYGVRLIKTYSLKSILSNEGTEIKDKMLNMGEDFYKEIPESLYKFTIKARKFDEKNDLDSALDLFGIDTLSNEANITSIYKKLLKMNSKKRENLYCFNVANMIRYNKKIINRVYNLLTKYSPTTKKA